eukprot:COSAG01_NODE_3772_length_5711_cov_67.083393_9_plen_75_part_00
MICQYFDHFFRLESLPADKVAQCFLGTFLCALPLGHHWRPRPLSVLPLCVLCGIQPSLPHKIRIRGLFCDNHRT